MFLIVILMVTAALVNASDVMNRSSNKKLIAYYPTWGIYARQYFIKDLPLDKLTHVTLAFVIPEIDGELDTKELRQLNFEELQKFKNEIENRDGTNFKIGIAIGGYGTCEAFVEMISNEENKNNFIKNCVNLVYFYKFDYLEIDWEYPVNSEQCHELKSIVTALKEKLPKNLEISMCIPCFQNEFMVKEMVGLIDFFVLMGYELYGGGWSETSGYHSALYPKIRDHVKYLNSNEGVPMKKIVLGCPLYAKTFAGCSVNHEKHCGDGIGLYGEKGVMDYSEVLKICKEIKYDPEVVSEYASFDNNFLSFDGPKTIEAKCLWVLENELGGVAFWNAAGDAKEESLITMASNLLLKNKD